MTLSKKERKTKDILFSQGLGNCAHCNTIQPIANFHTKNSGRYKIASVCIPCASKYKKERYYRESKEERLDARCKRYGITSDEYKEIYYNQSGKCAICFVGESETQHGKFDIDHCHETGKVRGLLCPKCNKALGLFDDDLGRLSRAKSYLKDK